MESVERERRRARTRTRVSVVVGATALPLLVAVACSTTLQGTLSIVTGPDNGFDASPPPVSLTIQLINSGTSDAATVVAQTALPAEAGFSIPPQPGDNVDIIQITGYDEAGSAVVTGATVPVALDQLSGITLNVFVQRNGQFSRLPSAEGGTAALFAWPDGSTLTKTPILTTLYARYLLVSDGTGTSNQTQLYDTLTWQLNASPPPLPYNPLSLAYVDTFTGGDAALEASTSVAALLVLGKGGLATWLDLTDSTGLTADAEVLVDAAGMTTTEIMGAAGGQTILTGTSGPGNTYIVGGTRVTGGATKWVLRISPSGVTSWTNLNTARLGAAAAYSASQTNPGLYIFGGAAANDGGTAGVEFVSDNAGTNVTTAMDLSSVPADPTKGAGAVTLDQGATILLAGGVLPNGHSAPTRLYSVASLNMSTVITYDAGVLDAARDATAADAAKEAAAVDAARDARDASKDSTLDSSRGSDAGTDATGDAGTDAGDAGDAFVEAGISAVSIWAPLPVVLETAQVFPLTDMATGGHYSAIVVGTDSSGMTHAYIITPTTVTPVTFRVPRTHGQAMLLPNSALAVVGGDSGTIESFIP